MIPTVTLLTPTSAGALTSVIQSKDPIEAHAVRQAPVWLWAIGKSLLLFYLWLPVEAAGEGARPSFLMANILQWEFTEALLFPSGPLSLLHTWQLQEAQVHSYSSKCNNSMMWLARLGQRMEEQLLKY